MLKFLACGVLLSVSACGSSSDSGAPPSAAAAAGAGATAATGCPDVSGTWTITQHCDATLVGQTLKVMQSDCTLSMASPFDQFMGSVTQDDKISLTGPQTCSGSATTDAVSMMCTPGNCTVVLAR